MVSINDPIPSFSLPSSSGKDISPENLKGTSYILYFYPKDSTPGCTIEANNFTNSYDEFKKCNTLIFGISKDSIKSHLNFINKQKIAFELISDIECSLCKKLDVWKEKSMFGKNYMGIERSTFLIDSSGIIRKIWRNVKISGHVDQVLLEAKNLFQLNKNESCKN